jgi:hypothetical protein
MTKIPARQNNKNLDPAPRNKNVAKVAAQVAVKANAADGREYERMAEAQQQKGGC